MKSRWHDCLASFLCLPLWVRIWVLGILIPANAVPFFLLDTQTGRAGALAALVVVAGNVPIMLWERGMSKLMAIPHLVAWIPLVAWLIGALARQQEQSAAESALAWSLVAINTVSLAFDAYDTVRWLGGERDVPRPIARFDTPGTASP